MVKLKPKNYASFGSCKENGTKIINVDIKNDIQIFDVTSKKTISNWNLSVDKKETILFSDCNDLFRLVEIATQDGMASVLDSDYRSVIGNFLAHPEKKDIRTSGLTIHPSKKQFTT